MIGNQRHQATWSKLSPVPSLHYHPHSASHIVYWNGVGMTRSTALMLVGAWWNFMWPTPKMKTKSYEEFVNAYRLGAFGNVNWDDIIKADPQQYFPQITKFVAKSTDQPVYELVKQYTVQEALSWFKTANESVIED